MLDERLVDRLVAGRLAGNAIEQRGIGVKSERRPGVVQCATTEERRGRRPELSVTVRVLRPQLAAERDELREIGDGGDVVQRRDTSDAVRVEIVAEQERRVVVGRGEQARPAVVD